jgi:hypothetical protein
LPYCSSAIRARSVRQQPEYSGGAAFDDVVQHAAHGQVGLFGHHTFRQFKIGALEQEFNDFLLLARLLAALGGGKQVLAAARAQIVKAGKAGLLADDLFGRQDAMAHALDLDVVVGFPFAQGLHAEIFLEFNRDVLFVARLESFETEAEAGNELRRFDLCHEVRAGGEFGRRGHDLLQRLAVAGGGSTTLRAE